MSQPLARAALPPALTNQAALDRALFVIICAAFLVLCAAPSRFMWVPFQNYGDYANFMPPGILDLLWAGVGLALFARVGPPTGGSVLGLGIGVLVGALGLVLNGQPDIYTVGDLLLFNFRVAGGLAIGSMLARAGFGGESIALMFLAGGLTVAVGTLPILLGWVSYDFYSMIQRYGSVGLGPNEAGLILTGAFNMLPGLMRDRPWPALAAPVLAMGTMATSSRTAVLLMIFGVGFWLRDLVRKARLAGDARRRRDLMISAAAFAISIWVVVAFVDEMVGQGALAAPRIRAMDTGVDESSTFRLTIYLDTIEYLVQNPAALLLGVGGSNVAVEWLLARVLPLGTYHTHDLALQMLTAYGVTGLVAGAILLWPLARRGARFPDIGSRALRAFALTLVAGQTIQYGLWQVKFLWLLVIALGFVGVASKSRVPPATGHASERGT